MDEWSPSALSWWLAVTLRQLREDAGVSREQAAEAIGSGLAFIGHIERAVRSPSPRQLEILLTRYGVPERIDEFLDLRERTKLGSDWWIGLDKILRPSFQLSLGLEISSPLIESWHSSVVPGLCQTEETAEAIIRASSPDLPESEIRRLVELRMTRQRKTLGRKTPLIFRPVISEAALRLQVGGRLTHRAQLERLLSEDAEYQVVPSSAGAYGVSEAAFTIFSAPAEISSPGCVYVADSVQDHYYDQPTLVSSYRDRLDRLRSRALDPIASKALTARILEDA